MHSYNSRSFLKERRFAKTILWLTFFHCVQVQAQGIVGSDPVAKEQMIDSVGNFPETLSRKFRSVKNEAKYGTPYETVEQLFAGRVAGVQVMETSGAPGGVFSVRLRGTSSLIGSAEPLYVIDGFPVEFFNPDFNARKINLNTESYSFNVLSMINPADIASVEILKDASALALYGMRGVNGVVLINTKKPESNQFKVDYESSFSIQKMTRKTSFLNTEDYLVNLRKLTLDYPHLQYFSDKFPGAVSDYENIDWMDEVTRIGQIHKQQIQLRGGMKHLRYAIQGGIFDHKGIVKSTRFDRKTLGVTLDSDFFKNRLKVGTRGYYGSGVNVQRSTRETQQAIPVGPIYNPDGSYYKHLSGEFPLANPLEMVRNNGSKNTGEQLMTNSYLEARPIKNLVLRSQYGIAASLHTNNFTWTPLTTMDASYVDVKDYFFSNSATYQWRVGAHRFSTNLGYINQKRSRKTATVRGAEDPAKYWRDEIRVDHYPVSENPFMLPAGLQSYSTSRRTAKMNSFYFNPGWALHEKFLVDLGFRKEVSQGGMASRKLDAYTMTSRVEWRLRSFKENDQEMLSTLNIHGDFGFLKKENGLSTLSFHEPEKERKEIKYTFSVGGNMGLWGDRLLIGLDLYRQHFKNVWFLPYEFAGVEYSYLNDFFDKMITKGADLTVVSKIINRKDMSWEVSGNVSLLLNKIKDPSSLYNLANDPNRFDRPLGSWFLLKSDGVWNTQEEIDEVIFAPGDPQLYPGAPRYVDQNGDGKIFVADRVYRGKTNPTVLYGMASDLSAGNWDFSLLLRGELGQKINNKTQSGQLGGVENVPYSVAANTWSPSNINGNLPGLGYSNSGASDLLLESGSFLRLQNLSVGYTFPLFGKNKSIRPYLSGQNLLLLTPYKGSDPEVNWMGQHAHLRGTDQGAYPRARTFTLGVQVHL